MPLQSPLIARCYVRVILHVNRQPINLTHANTVVIMLATGVGSRELPEEQNGLPHATVSDMVSLPEAVAAATRLLGISFSISEGSTAAVTLVCCNNRVGQLCC